MTKEQQIENLQDALRAADIDFGDKLRIARSIGVGGKDFAVADQAVGAAEEKCADLLEQLRALTRGA